MSIVEFTKLNLSKEILKAISGIGFKKTSPIQGKAIPVILSGRDIIGQAATGTGKTAAFGLPLIEKINANSRDIQSLVLCPTRELAIQVAREITKYLKYKHKIKVLPIYGGQPIHRQIYGLRKHPQIIVGTPGRILDHMKRGTLSMLKIKILVLDEADEMLDMGFRFDIEEILSVMPNKKQTLLFSATMPTSILDLTKKYQKNPKLIKMTTNNKKVSVVEQIAYGVEPEEKTAALMKLVDKHNPELSLVFCNTRRKVDKVAKTFIAKGYRAAGIHGDIRQNKRDAIMSRFRNKKINILIATDVAARGIDVSNLEIVFNYEIPRDAISYVHRIGRTGRMGKTGKALSLVSRRETGLIRRIEYYTKKQIKKEKISIQKKNYQNLRNT